MKNKTLRLIFFVLAILAIFLIFLVVRNQIVDIIKFARAKDQEGIKRVLADKGVWGIILIVVIEAIQMIIVFIPAEFIQLAAGISYPSYFAFLYCLAGIFVGATVIYIMVNVLKINRSIFYRSSKKLDEMVSRKKQNVTIQTLMYLLFIMPVLPIGAICYFGASSKISYRRYIITCLTGVMPSIITSIAIGQVLIRSLSEGKSIVGMLAIVIGAVVVLFAVIIFILNKKFFVADTNKYRPNGIYYNVFYFVFSFFLKIKFRAKINRDGLEDIQGPALILINHASFWDFILSAKIMSPHRVTIVTNRYYFRNRHLKKFFSRLSVIPKRLFYPDIQTIKSVLAASKANRYIVMFPEGRLSTDGTNFNIVEGAGALIKKMQAQLVIANIHGAYMAKPKWAKYHRRGVVEIGIKKKLSFAELNDMSIEEIEQIINDNIVYNEFDFAKENKLKYHGKKFAEGLEGILYYCPECHQEFTLKTHKNEIKCQHCGFSTILNNDYSFSDNSQKIENIAKWNELQKKYEYLNLKNPDYQLQTKIKVQKLHPDTESLDEWGTGVCTLNKQEFTFQGTINETEVSFHISTKQLKALAFSTNLQFECYYDNYLYYFYPLEQPEQCAKWSLVQDEIFQMVKDQ